MLYTVTLAPYERISLTIIPIYEVSHAPLPTNFERLQQFLMR